MGSCQAGSADELRRLLTYLLDDQAAANGVSLMRQGEGPRFRELIEGLAAHDGKIVILVDEYDKPLFGQLGTLNFER